MNASDVVSSLGLAPHPEGGWYRETWRDPGTPRGAGTAIYYLLEEGQRSHWHRVDAAEMWHWYAGCALSLRIWDGSTEVEHGLYGPTPLLTPPQVLVPAGQWQSAEPVARPGAPPWVLVGCTVSPAFVFEGFDMAPPDWNPPA
ncbi:MAG: cupin domain-containing protein [Pseudomonadota bacterium]